MVGMVAIVDIVGAAGAVAAAVGGGAWPAPASGRAFVTGRIGATVVVVMVMAAVGCCMAGAADVEVPLDIGAGAVSGAQATKAQARMDAVSLDNMAARVPPLESQRSQTVRSPQRFGAETGDIFIVIAVWSAAMGEI
jgi:apolipoprotein N-acyltransferase